MFLLNQTPLDVVLLIVVAVTGQVFGGLTDLTKEQCKAKTKEYGTRDFPGTYGIPEPLGAKAKFRVSITCKEDNKKYNGQMETCELTIPIPKTGSASTVQASPKLRHNKIEFESDGQWYLLGCYENYEPYIDKLIPNVPRWYAADGKIAACGHTVEFPVTRHGQITEYLPIKFPIKVDCNTAKTEVEKLTLAYEHDGKKDTVQTTWKVHEMDFTTKDGAFTLEHSTFSSPTITPKA